MKASITIVAALLLGTACAPALAQESDRPADAHKRNNCRLAAQVLTSGHPHPRHEWARTYIVDCEDEGPAYFANQWSAASGDTATLRQLMAGSSRVRDARVYAVLRQVAVDGSRPGAVRVAAMLTLAGYVDPGITIDLSELQPPTGTIERIRFRGGTSIHAVQVQGAQPLGSVTAEVLSLLNAVAANRSSEPREVWYAAAVLARRIDMDIAARQRSQMP
jgi:hypothetical protein